MPQPFLSEMHTHGAYQDGALLGCGMSHVFARWSESTGAEVAMCIRKPCSRMSLFRSSRGTDIQFGLGGHISTRSLVTRSSQTGYVVFQKMRASVALVPKRWTGGTNHVQRAAGDVDWKLVVYHLI